MSRILIGLAALALSALAHATEYFSWDCEALNNVVVQGVTRSVTPHDSNSTLVTSPAPAAGHGSKSCSYFLVGNDARNQALGWDLDGSGEPAAYGFSYVGGPSIYYRWWMLLPATFDWGTGSGQKIKWHRNSASGHLASEGGYTGYILNGAIHLGEANDSDTGETPAEISFSWPLDGQWHEYIVRVKPNSTTSSTDAEFEFWQDGVSIDSITGFHLIGLSGNMLDNWADWGFYPYAQLDGEAYTGNPATGDGGPIYVDSFSTADTFNSIFSGSPPPSYRLQIRISEFDGRWSQQVDFAANDPEFTVLKVANE